MEHAVTVESLLAGAKKLTQAIIALAKVDAKCQEIISAQEEVMKNGLLAYTHDTYITFPDYLDDSISYIRHKDHFKKLIRLVYDVELEEVARKTLQEVTQEMKAGTPLHKIYPLTISMIQDFRFYQFSNAREKNLPYSHQPLKEYLNTN